MIQGLCYFMAFGITLFFMFVIGVICDLPKHFQKRNRFMTCAHYYIYMAFMDMIKERKLQPYMLVMNYKQIISMLNVPELNLKNTIIDPSCYCIEDSKAFLLIYTYKHYKGEGLSKSILYKSLREKNGLILFIPKSYRDYRKLCRYFADIDISQEASNTTAEQMDSLKYLTDLIHQAQDNSAKTLQDCQSEMDKYLEGKL
jgi:hypothetical protein